MCLLQQCGPAGGAGPSCPADAAARSLFRVMSKHTARVGDSKAALRASVATRQTEVRTRSRGQAVLLRRLADRQRCRAVPGSGHTPAPCPACVIPAAGPARTAAGRLISCSDAASRLQAGRERSAETPSQPRRLACPAGPLPLPRGAGDAVVLGVGVLHVAAVEHEGQEGQGQQQPPRRPQQLHPRRPPAPPPAPSKGRPGRAGKGPG